MGTELEAVDAQKGTMKDIFARCLKKNIAQVCTLTKSSAYCKKKKKFQFIVNLPCTNMSCNNRCLFFRRLKINHESHEFILDPGTVVNTYSDLQFKLLCVLSSELGLIFMFALILSHTSQRTCSLHAFFWTC
jgi:hypothetical protein